MHWVTMHYALGHYALCTGSLCPMHWVTMHYALWTITSPPGNLTSPNFPSNYPNYLDRTDTIVTKGPYVVITFTAFDVEEVEYCGVKCCDHLTIKDGGGTIRMNQTCGSTIPSMIEIWDNTFQVIFHTDNALTESGWSLNWGVFAGGQL